MVDWGRYNSGCWVVDKWAVDMAVQIEQIEQKPPMQFQRKEPSK